VRQLLRFGFKKIRRTEGYCFYKPGFISCNKGSERSKSPAITVKDLNPYYDATSKFDDHREVKNLSMEQIYRASIKTSEICATHFQKVESLH
jgi:hypothetical protein